uniref:Thioredoxin domain-containing protein n=1 Tax=Arcella intermedia TaxID=1963864 RepID=A0A6B2LRT4_9EUKA
MKLEDALKASEESGKAVMVLFTKPWCGACKTLKSDLNANKDLFLKAAQLVHIVNIEEDGEAGEKILMFTEQGSYIPRVFFLRPGGSLLPIEGPNPSYPRFFSSTQALSEAIHKAAQLVSSTKTDL